jgi:fructokinase
MSDSHTILCFGEIVWDALPEGIFLGGAPLNVAYHLNRHKQRALPVSAIGVDFLGDETVRRLEAREIPADLVNRDGQRPTGAVVVALNASGDARYTILENAAWDAIPLSTRLREEAARSTALVYGSLALREAPNRETLSFLVEKVPLRLCDVNLRAPYDRPDSVLPWARKATHIKLNDEELEVLSPVPPQEGLEVSLKALAELTGVDHLILTRGGEGAAVLAEGAYFEAAVPEVEVADTVGAGDAFTAAYLNALIQGKAVADCLQAAVKLGAYVAGRNGAQPDYAPSV